MQNKNKLMMYKQKEINYSQDMMGGAESVNWTECFDKIEH
jgi:hypothetical protein